MGKGGLTRRGLTAGLAAAVVPAGATSSESGDAVWPMLVEELQAAEGVHRAAMASLADAERCLYALPARRRRRSPSNLCLAQRAEAVAVEAVEAVHRRVVMTAAVTKEGLLVKMRLMASAYGIGLDAAIMRPGEHGDLMSCLIRSLIVDLSAGQQSARR